MEYINEAYQKRLKAFFKQVLPEQFDREWKIIGPNFYLPWNRTFDIGINLEIKPLVRGE